MFGPMALTALVALFANACGQPSTPSQVSNASHDTCVAAAKLKKTQAYDQAAKSFEAEASGCYALMDDQHFIPVSICLKKAEAARKQALADADRAWKDAMSICEPR